jgi:predicted transcriptional regulator YdeE
MIHTLGPVYLIGMAMKKKTFNAHGQSAIDCGNHWQEFSKQETTSRIPDKLSEDIYAVYYEYEGDHTKPYSYFIGCRVPEHTQTPEGLDSLTIPESTGESIIARGVLPDCVAAAWQEIWKSGLPRAYGYDFEVYDQRSHDWENAVVEIFLSVRPTSSFPG